MPLAPLPRIENVSKMPFCPVAPTPGTRVIRSWKSAGAAMASSWVTTSVARADGQSLAVPLAVTRIDSVVHGASLRSGSPLPAAAVAALARRSASLSAIASSSARQGGATKAAMLSAAADTRRWKTRDMEIRGWPGQVEDSPNLTV